MSEPIGPILAGRRGLDSEPTIVQLALRAADSAAERYSEQGAIRAVFQLVPVVGPVLDSLIGTRGTQLALERFGVLLDEIRKEVDHVGEEKLDRSFFESEEWADLFIRALQAARQTRDREKIHALAAIVVRSGQTPRPTILDVETVLQLVADLSPALLERAAQLYREHHQEPSAFATGIPIPAWGPESTFVMQRLEAAGLVTRIIDASRLSPGAEIVYDLTPTFQMVMELVGAEGRQ